MYIENKVIKHIDSIEQDFKMLDNILKCIDNFWKGEGAEAVKDIYNNVQSDIEKVLRDINQLKERVIEYKEGNN